MAIDTFNPASDRFYNCHFKSPIPKDIVRIADEVAKITSPQRSMTGYRIHSVLNQISQAIYETTTYSESIVFVAVESPMPHHPSGYRGPSPPIVAVRSSVYEQLRSANKWTPSWHHVLSVVEPIDEVNTTAHAEACGTSLALLMQARPDMITFYGLALPSLESATDKWLNTESYELRCSTAAGFDQHVYRSDNLIPLTAYVHRLYGRRPVGMYDPSIVLEPSTLLHGAPRWKVYIGPGKSKVYRNCKVTNVGWPWHRMTWVAETHASNGNPILIKDAYRRRHGYFVEREIYDVLHDRDEAERNMKCGDINQRYTYNRDVPGFCIILASLDVPCSGNHDIIRVGEGVNERIKARLVMATSGEPLTKCTSVLAFAKAMYDVVQAHRYAFEHLNILHRDISLGNIVINPKEARKPRILDTPDRPKFITETLDKTRKFAPPLSRLIDLDGTAEYDASKAATPTFRRVLNDMHYLPDQPTQPGQFTRHLQFCSGTPGFISRANCTQGICYTNFQFEPMPELEGRARKLYEAQYSPKEHPLRFFVDSTQKGSLTFHGGSSKVPRDVLGRSTWCQHPRDDVESMFWSIVWFYSRAAPLHETKDEQIEDDYRYDTFASPLDDIELHTISKTSDSRASILGVPLDTWKRCYLHPKLTYVAPLLVDLAKQVRPNYRRLSPAPPPLHLHEAVSRILLKYIVQWEDEGCDVELDTKRGRDTLRPSVEREKRKASEEVDNPNIKRRRDQDFGDI
ncbi:hypothetical protein ONZ45_g9729 [Pleurotus djamor]|nr:hypothetical protein ONZ45_g9729 [Pleurotus djamor]